MTLHRKAAIGALSSLLLGWMISCKDKAPPEQENHAASTTRDRPAQASSRGRAGADTEPLPVKDLYAPASMPVVSADIPVEGPSDRTFENEKTGIAECDTFVHAMNSCYLPKVSPRERDQILGAMKQERFAWKEASASDSVGTRAKCAKALQDRSSVLKQAGCL